MSKRATTGERIVMSASGESIEAVRTGTHSSQVRWRCVARGIDRAIARAVKKAQHAERMICAIIVGAHREGNMHTKRAAPVVCDDIIRAIVATPKAATVKRGNRKGVRCG